MFFLLSCGKYFNWWRLRCLSLNFFYLLFGSRGRVLVEIVKQLYDFGEIVLYFGSVDFGVAVFGVWVGEVVGVVLGRAIGSIFLLVGVFTIFGVEKVRIWVVWGLGVHEHVDFG
jgi:hypothetical protein